MKKIKEKKFGEAESYIKKIQDDAIRSLFLKSLADKKNALLVTTEKDIKRIDQLNVNAFKKIISLPIDIEFENEAEVRDVLEKIFNEFNKKL